MIRNTLSALAGLLLLTAVVIPARAEIVPTDVALGEMSLGKKDAPVVIYAFESLTCPHCRAFQETTYKELKKKYVETGKVRIVFKDFPLNGQAFYGTLVARCLGPKGYVGMTEALFENQDKWAFKGGKDFFKTLSQFARLAGMTDADFQKCISDKKLIQGVQAAQKVDAKKYKVDSTPTFIVGTPKTIETDAAKRIEGAQPFETFEQVIKSVLPAADK
jgi:protein-disulfide isomerase